VTCADALSIAAVQLAKSAQLLPALLVCDAQTSAVPGQVIAVRIDQVGRYALPGADDLVRVSEAGVPLRDGVVGRVVLFRDRREASEPVAGAVGAPGAAGAGAV